MQLRRGPQREDWLVETNLGPEWAQVDGLDLQALVAGPDGNPPARVGARVPPEIGLAFPYHVQDQALDFSRPQFLTRGSGEQEFSGRARRRRDAVSKLGGARVSMSQCRETDALAPTP